MRNLEYLAGLFDGEGSFSIQISLRQYKNNISAMIGPSMSVNLYYGSEVLDHFVDAFGGKIYPYQKDGRPCGRRWHLGRHVDVTAAATTLAPFLEIKRDIATNFIRALSLFPKGTDVSRKHGERAWTPKRTIAVAEIALTLNPQRSRKSNKTLEYLQVLRDQLKNNSCQPRVGGL